MVPLKICLGTKQELDTLTVPPSPFLYDTTFSDWLPQCSAITCVDVLMKVDRGEMID